MYPMGYIIYMIEVRETQMYTLWFRKLRDRQAKARILARIRRLSLGNPGDIRSLGEGVLELKIDYGPGYRIYYKQREKTLVILLAGGDKRTQQQDIEKAKNLSRRL